jgi:uncharacterized membrane protein
MLKKALLVVVVEFFFVLLQTVNCFGIGVAWGTYIFDFSHSIYLLSGSSRSIIKQAKIY